MRPSGFVTRFAGWPPAAARLVLAGLAALMLYGAAIGLVPGLAPPLPPSLAATGDDPQASDAALYGAIAARVAGGEGYYAAAVAEHRLRDYPLKPFVTVRPPTLATLQAGLGMAGAGLLLALLVAVALVVLARRLETALPGGRRWIVVLALVAVGISFALLPVFVVWHEAWAAVLIVLSLACRSPRRYGVGLLVGLLAVAIREIALPYLLVMAVLAALEGHRREALAWFLAILTACGLLAAHAAMVAAATLPTDLASQGWLRAAGWPFVVTTIRNCTALAFLPLAAAGVLVPVCLLGWAAWAAPLGNRIALLLLGYAGAFLAFGRPENFYWGLLVAPLVLAGLAFAPAALADLWRAAFTGRR
ncbi:hypothetical protein [Methylobacterium sp. Leaf108]|uniref:hypothetical protein n=1 Tax=Methylobacterium sp. Leaf108 TaxID=1736256 RepID=UPI0006F403F3|nr:hypothetical protein [Methylobacterium sp. Leaf108]KQP48968.1 hypothetical protein ASF39_14555 [Methylobacterium sp. Leaf108]